MTWLFAAASVSRRTTASLTRALLPQVVGTMKELYSFTGSSNATLDLPVGNELSEGGRASEVCLRLWALPAPMAAYMRPARKQSVSQEHADAPRPLYVVMACMRDIRKRSDRTDACFDPLRDTVRTACLPRACQPPEQHMSWAACRWRCCCAVASP